LLLNIAGAVGTGDLKQQWQEMITFGICIQSEVLFPLKPEEPPTRMLFHAMALHKGVDEGKFLVTLCSGFRAISGGPDEVARSRAVLETAVDAIVTINSEGTISSMNPATMRMFGYSEQELDGQNVSVLMPEPFKGQHDEYLRTYLQTGKASIIGIGRQVVGRKKNGQEFPVYLTVSEFSVHGTRYFTGIIRDLTELERVQKQLLQSERLAAIGQMVTGLAHESRNALQRAQACLDMLSLDLQDSPEQRDLARRATTALQDLHRLYEEVRSYAAPIHLEFRECDLSTIWRREWENVLAVRRDKRITLIEPEENERLRCEVDVHRMEQVFRNVLENAIHACSSDGVITIRASLSDLNGEPAARIAVQDDGAGMSVDVAKHLFEPFFTTKQKGTGLGMAIVQRIMMAHGGSVTAGAIHPRGTEILFMIPIRGSIRNGVRS
jgi:PAS domain S-box-containing protein